MSSREERTNNRTNKQNSTEVEELRKQLRDERRDAEERLRKKSEERRDAVKKQLEAEERVRKKSEERREAVKNQLEAEKKARDAERQADRSKEIGLRTYNAKPDRELMILFLQLTMIQSHYSKSKTLKKLSRELFLASCLKVSAITAARKKMKFLNKNVISF